jgi:hypothetical protein
VESTDDQRAIAALVDRSVDTSVPEVFGAYLFVDGDPAAEIARSVERSVFLEAFGNTRELLEAEYGPYERSSLFACIVDHRAHRPAGVIRLILPTPGGPGLKSLNDVEPAWGTPAPALLERVGICPGAGRMWDAATLAVAAEYRTAAATGLVSLALYQSIVAAAQSAGAEWFCALLDRVVFRVANAKFAVPFDAYGEGRPYLGSPLTLPVTVDLAGWRARLAAREPEICEIVYGGVGLEPVLRSVPRPMAEALTRRLLASTPGATTTRPSRVESPSRDASRAERAR